MHFTGDALVDHSASVDPVHVDVTPVPEPSTLLMAVTAFLTLAALRLVRWRGMNMTLANLIGCLMSGSVHHRHDARTDGLGKAGPSLN